MPTNTQVFFQRIKELPVLFPLVALFHVVQLVMMAVTFSKENVLLEFAPALSMAWMLLYTVLWICICLRQRWALYSYLAFTAINLAIQYALPADEAWKEAAAVMAPAHLPVDALMCFFLLLYYKRIQ